MQYTIRGVPVAVDQAVRERARAESKSLNELHDRDRHFDHLPQIVRV